MAFVSLAFLGFISVVGLAYFAVPHKYRWLTLLVASYIFYFINSQWLILIIFAQTVVTFVTGRYIQKGNDQIADLSTFVKAAKKAKEPYAKESEELAKIKNQVKWLARFGVLANLLTLLFLKYFNFFAGSANVILVHLGIQIPSLGLLLPIGLSFYTLQAIAYVCDVRRGRTQADSSLPKFMLFMSYFPQILQGPIPRYKHLAQQLYEGHNFDYQRLCHGAQLIMWGFFKKLVIADRIAMPVNQIFDGYTEYSGLLVFLAAAGYGIQVYADFSGGVDIARGFSQIIGINMEENFRQPYFSKSIEEFWRRWHMTLGGFMRDYVFYPLSLSKMFARVGKNARKTFGPKVGKRIPPFIAMFVVYFCVGFWHGANWTFIAYGVWNGIFIMSGILLVDVYANAKNRCKIRDDAFPWMLFQMIRTFCICSLGRLFSRADTLPQALGMGRSILHNITDISFLFNGEMLNFGLNTANWFVLGIAVLLFLFTDIMHEREFHFREWIGSKAIAFRWVIYISFFAIILIFGVYGVGYDDASFIYQQF